MLNFVSVPEGVEDATVRGQLLNELNIEIGGGLGDFKGKVWRVGLVGSALTQSNVMLFLLALEKCLIDQAIKFDRGASIAAAAEKACQLSRCSKGTWYYQLCFGIKNKAFSGIRHGKS